MTLTIEGSPEEVVDFLKRLAPEEVYVDHLTLNKESEVKNA